MPCQRGLPRQAGDPGNQAVQSPVSTPWPAAVRKGVCARREQERRARQVLARSPGQQGGVGPRLPSSPLCTQLSGPLSTAIRLSGSEQTRGREPARWPTPVLSALPGSPPAWGESGRPLPLPTPPPHAARGCSLAHSPLPFNSFSDLHTAAAHTAL